MRRLLSLLLLTLMATAATAAPVRFMPVTLIQPQGDTLHCYVSGDEFFHRLHDADGYTIVQDPVTGQYVYAALAEGDLVPTTFVAGKDNPGAAGLRPNLVPDAKHLKPANTQDIGCQPRDDEQRGYLYPFQQRDLVYIELLQLDRRYVQRQHRRCCVDV